MVGRSDHVTFLSLIKLCCALTDTNQLLAVRDYLTPKTRTQLEMTNGCDNTVYYRNIKLNICTSRESLALVTHTECLIVTFTLTHLTN